MIVAVVLLLLWLVYPAGMGYGDVRLSGVLGIALGYLGWGELLIGVYGGVPSSACSAASLAAAAAHRSTLRKPFPFGPFMLVGALVGVVWGTVADPLRLG